MKKSDVKLDTLKAAVQILDYSYEKKWGILKMKKSRLATDAHIFKTETNAVYVNFSGAVTYQFDNEDDYYEFMTKNFEEYKSEKEMYIKGWDMTEEAWNNWNNETL